MHDSLAQQHSLGLWRVEVKQQQREQNRQQRLPLAQLT